MTKQKSDRSLPITASILSLLLATTTSAEAQIIPDNTLPNNTIVAPNGQTINIEGGTRSGGNLFHSFQEFNLGAASTAFFNNAVDIQNILSRVTGGKISNIDGLIRANGGANLFFINPAGIVFGPNARLNIGGSFLATSAERVMFEDGSFFSATEPNAPPLLTVKVPIGLQMGTNPGAILVRGSGHKLSRENELVPFDRSELLRAPAGLQVQPGNTLAIVGGDVVIEGGILTALEGRIELGSVKQGNVNINRTSEPRLVGNLGYQDVGQFGDILLKERSLVDASSLLGGGGSIQVRGQNLELQDVSVILIQNFGDRPSGNITINAAESVTLSGADSNNIRTVVATDAIGSEKSGDINISTPRLLIENGAGIDTFTYGPSGGSGGDINILAPDAIEVIGVSSAALNILSLITTIAVGNANAGNLNVSTGKLRIVDGASIGSTTLGQGSGGIVEINAGELVEIVGVEPSNFIASTLSVFAGREGTAGNLTVNTPRLIVKDGGRVSASTVGSGNAGSMTINASESVLVTGRVSGSVNPSLIDSSADIPDESIQRIFDLPPIPTGNTGELTINTPRLTVAHGGLVGVQHEGTGNAGALRINAGQVLVESGGGITAASASGLGGNLSLNVRDSLLLRDSGSITAEAGGGGDGGNLTINAETIVLLRNSNINANAFEGRGGNIRIVTEGLFPDARGAITASSQLGVDGTVEVKGLDNEASNLVELSNSLPELTTLIASGCEAYAGSEFIITGRGGLPPNPIESMTNINPIIEWAPPEENLQSSQRLEVGSRYPTFKNQDLSSNTQLVEATGWARRSDGVVELVANTGNAGNSWHRLPECPSSF